MTDSSLAGPIIVRRPKRWGRKIFWSLVVLALLGCCLVVVRVALLPFPAFDARAKPPGDGWRLLRGIVNLQAEPGDVATTRQRLADAFTARMDFAVLAEAGGIDLRPQVSDAALAVLHAQDVESSRGCFLVVNAQRVLQARQADAGSPFELVRQLGGWSIIVRPLDGTRGWQAWDELRPDAFEILNASSHLGQLDAWGLATHWIGWVLGLDAAKDHLGRRPTAALAHWDDYTRRGPVMGLCGLDSADSQAGPVTYLFVRDGLGPYGPVEVETALKAGHHFCALPAFGDPSGFRFFAMPATGGVVLGNMGDKVDLGQGVELVADLNLTSAPGNLVLVLYQDGVEILRVRGARLSYRTEAPGAYRIEALVETQGLPWTRVERTFLYSNPIYVMGNK